MSRILFIVFPVFCVVGLGYVLGLFRKISLEPIIETLLYLTIPALAVSALTQASFPARDVFTIALSAGAVVFGTGIISFIYLSAVKRRDLHGFYLPAMFMNSGNMAFPLALFAFGPAGLAAAVIYYTVISILVYSLGIYIAKGRAGIGEMFRLPLIYAAAAGLFLNFSGLALPSALEATLKMLGDATIPLMLITLGYQLHSARLSHAALSLAACVIRIGGGFAIAYLIVGFFGIEGTPGRVIILSSAMPSAVINFIISYRYRVHSELVSSAVVLSTLLSIATTPLVIAVIV
jgi:predicted permease